MVYFICVPHSPHVCSSLCATVSVSTFLHSIQPFRLIIFLINKNSYSLQMGLDTNQISNWINLKWLIIFLNFWADHIEINELETKALAKEISANKEKNKNEWREMNSKHKTTESFQTFRNCIRYWINKNCFFFSLLCLDRLHTCLHCLMAFE